MRNTTRTTTRRRAAALALLGTVAATTVAVATTGPATGAAAPTRPATGAGAGAASDGAAEAGTAHGWQRAGGESQLTEVRAATARFHDVAVAEAEGYVPAGHCEEMPGVGAMGIHYLNPALASDAVVDPARPEVLLYLPTGNGLRLVGVEWFVAEVAAGGTHPEVFGVPFDGPMAGHGPGMPIHYDLHAWVWAHNPTGMFAAWNPSLSCGEHP